MYKRCLKVIGIFCVITLLVAAMTGCGGEKDSGQNSTTTQANVEKSNSAEKEVIKLRIGAGHIPDAVQWVYSVANYFVPEVAKRVEENTNYKIEWIEAYGGTVAKLGEVLEAVDNGLLDLGYVCFPFEPTKLMPHGLTYKLPFQSDDPVMVCEAAIELFEEFPELNAEIEKYNQKPLGVSVSDPYNLFTTFPCANVDDLKDKKIAGAGANLLWIENTGAIPVQSNLNEGYTSMQTGVYEGFINPTGAMYDYKIHEVSRYLLITGFGAQLTGTITINNNCFNKLPKEVQDIIIEVGREYSLEEANYTKNKYQSDVDALEADGVTVTVLSQEDKEKWANMIPNVPGNMAKELNEKGYSGTEIVEFYFRKLEESGLEMPREWELE